MAVKARAEITLSSIRDVQSVTRYYLLQSSTSAVPTKPTTNPPGGNWVTTEPTYTTGSTKSLYFVDLTVFSDGTFAYSDVSLSSSYEAAKVAYNKAVSAEGVANSASDKVDNLEVGGRNLYVVKDAQDGYINSSNGSVSGMNATNREQISDFIPVTEGEKLVFQAWAVTTATGNKAGSAWLGYAFYDSEKVYLGTRPNKYDGTVQADGYTYNFYKITVPANAAFIRCSYRRVTDGKAKLERGSVATDWSPAPEDLNEKIDNLHLQIGGRNLLLNSEHFIPDSGIFSGSTATPYNHPALDGELPYYASGSKYVKVTFPNLTIGEQYAFSCEVARQSGGSSTPVYITINGEEAVKVGTATASVWTKFNVIFTATSSTTYAKVQVNTAAPSGSAGWVAHFRRFKLEWGNMATDWSPAPEDLDEAITAAQETANGKNTVYYQASAPTGGTYKVNDIWFDTNDGNKMYMWNGSVWTAETFGTAAISDLSITNAKIANATIQSAKIASLDAGKVTTGTMSAARIKGDTLTLGGANNVDGVMEVYDADGTLVGQFTREGLMAIAGTIGGWTIGATELGAVWDENSRHWVSRLAADYGISFEETLTDEGYEQWLRKVYYGLSTIAFTNRAADGTQASAFLSSDQDKITISPKLQVDERISSPALQSDQLELKELANGIYVRQPAMILSGVVTISTGTSAKNVTLCTVPSAYQSGYRIVPFVSRRYGSATGTPSDDGDFYYAYYNSVNHNVYIKLANVLPSGVIYQFDYMIYAVPE